MEVGDVVFLNSGTTAMTVVEVMEDDGEVTVAWHNADDDLIDATLPIAALEFGYCED